MQVSMEASDYITVQNKQAMPGIRKDQYSLLGLAFASVGLLIILLALLGLQILPRLLDESAFLQAQKNEEYLYVAILIVGMLWAGTLAAYLLQKRMESISLTHEYCEIRGITGRCHRMQWKEVRRVRYGLVRGCIEFHSDDNVARIYNVFAVPREAVSFILSRPLQGAARSESIKLLEHETLTGGCRHPFYGGGGLPVLSALVCALRSRL